MLFLFAVSRVSHSLFRRADLFSWRETPTFLVDLTFDFFLDSLATCFIFPTPSIFWIVKCPQHSSEFEKLAELLLNWSFRFPNTGKYCHQISNIIKYIFQDLKQCRSPHRVQQVVKKGEMALKRKQASVAEKILWTTEKRKQFGIPEFLWTPHPPPVGVITLFLAITALHNNVHISRIVLSKRNVEPVLVFSTLFSPFSIPFPFSGLGGENVKSQTFFKASFFLPNFVVEMGKQQWPSFGEMRDR